MLSVLLVLFGSSSVYAKDKDSNDSKKTGLYADGYYDATTGETVAAVYRMNAEGQLYEVPLDQWLKEKEAEIKLLESDMRKAAAFKASKASISTNTQSSIGSVSPFSSYTFNTYEESTNTFVRGLNEKMSNNVNCTTSGQHCLIQAQWSVTTGHEFSANIGSQSQKGAVQSGVSYTFSSSTTSSMSYTLFVPMGKTGYLQFTPFMRYSSGYVHLKYYNFGTVTLLGSEWSWVKYPMKLSSGATDGEWTIVIV